MKPVVLATSLGETQSSAQRASIVCRSTGLQQTGFQQTGLQQAVQQRMVQQRSGSQRSRTRSFDYHKTARSGVSAAGRWADGTEFPPTSPRASSPRASSFWGNRQLSAEQLAVQLAVRPESLRSRLPLFPSARTTETTDHEVLSSFVDPASLS